MSPSVQELRNHANQILSLLDQGFPFSMGPEERKAILTEAGRVLHKLDSIERNFLSIGLLGGTGVGKSTLMNALAGAKIASASHRRPHTDDVLIYRHEEVDPLPFLQQSSVPFREITHGRDSIRRILLCDLPDFDSIAAEHSERVVRFLEHLDLLVWITSLEKYGDGRFYEFLRAVPKAKPNFVFVLNKIDLLFQENDHQNGYHLLERTLLQFQNHLRQNGMDTPLLYALAADQAMDPARTAQWNQFPLFRQHLFQQREIKEIRTIRSANLDVELKGIFSLLEREAVHLRTLTKFLDLALQDLETRKSAWVREAGEAIAAWIRKEWTAILMRRRGSPALVGPGQAIDLLVREFRRMGKEEKPTTSDFPSPALPETVLSMFRAQMEETDERIKRQMLVHSLPEPLLERMESILNVSGRVSGFENTMTKTVAVHGQVVSAPRLWRFRIVQHLTYALLFILFLVAIGGREAWEGIITNPDWRSGLRLLASWINTLFSTQGLAALGSYVLLNLYLGFRFYRRQRRILERVAEKPMKHTREALLEIWEAHIQSLVGDLKEFRSDIRDKISLVDGSK